MRNEQVTITRGQIGQWSSYLGGTGLLVGILGLLWQGGFTMFIGLMLAAGVVGMVLWAVFLPGDFKGFFTGRQVRYGTTAVFATLVLIAVVALAYLIAARATITADFTQSSRFSLSEETLAVLEQIDRSIQITGFYSPRILQAREIDDQIFRLYETATSGKIRRVFIDPDEQPGIAQQFGATGDGNVYVSYLNADGTVDFNSLARIPLGTTSQERDVTGAISRLLISGSITVYFETGLTDLDPLDSGQQGLSGINNGIQESGLITAPLNLRELALANRQIPDNAATIIMVRPVNDLTSEELSLLDAYLNRGGTLFLMADALGDGAFLRENTVFNQYLWERYGLRTRDAVVVENDPALTRGSPLDIIGAVAFTNTSIAQRLDPAENPTLFRVARALEVDLETAPTQIANGQILLSSGQSYGETNLAVLADSNTVEYDEGVDLKAPLATAAWAWDQNTGAKILLVGDSDYLTNGFVLSSLGNAVLFTDGLAWLTGLDERVTFAPQAFATALPLVNISTQQLDTIAFITILVIPGIVLFTALVVWSRRSRQ